MRFLAFDKSGTPTIGVRRDREVVDLSVAAPDLPRDMPGLLGAGQAAMDAAAAAMAETPVSTKGPRALSISKMKDALATAYPARMPARP